LDYVELDDTARLLELGAGELAMGVRLRPGATLRFRELNLAFARTIMNSPVSAGAIAELVAEHALSNDGIMDAIAKSRSVTEAARQEGVSQRSLHRRLISLTRRPPSYWLDLGRARRALAALPSELPLAEIAYLAGYADQAHLTRSFSFRFGTTPGRFRRSNRLMRLAGHQGFSG
jgi:AraC-like DNA-binding protein